MKIIGIEHIGIAVNDLNTSSSFWENILNIVHTHTEDIESEGVSTKIFDTGKGKIELLDSLDKNSPIHKFLQKRGPGIHHICLEVDNINNAISELKKFKIDILNDSPSIGAEGYKIVFIHPRSTGGVLVELAEKPAK
jgi:methylmalonyl-CoA/ethylmalonyl-CoA epimerase